MIQWKNRWTILVVVILTAAGLAAIPVKKGSIQEKPAADNVRLVETETVSSEKVSRYSELSGTLSPGEEAVISFEASGRITEMYYQEGDLVPAGAIVAQMEATEYSLLLARSETELDKSRMAYQKARDDFNRMEELYRHGALSKSDYEKVQNSFTVAEKDYQLARQSYSLVNEGKNQLRAPIGGTIIAKLSSVGQLAGTGVPVYRIGQVNPLKVTLPVPDSEISTWKKDDSVTLLLYNDSREGRVTRILPSTNQGTGAIGVEVTVDNSLRDWFPGQVVRARRAVETIEGLFVPVQAVVNHGEEKPYVFLAAGDRAVKTTVTTGRLIGNRLEILSGIKPGKLVVVRGAEQLFDGSAIRQAGVIK
ncbi:MAG: efflux RND transporter periplasmic adaptor subunit [Bacillota bacterium]